MIERQSHLKPLDFSQYQSIIHEELFSEIKQKSQALQGKKITHVNATANGGGVAEILTSLIPLLNSLGLEASWYVIQPDKDFFAVSKEMHNFLQGKQGTLSEKDKEIYLKKNREIAAATTKIDTDLWFIHDPQPAAAVAFNPNLHPSIWRCHIDTSYPNPDVWNFLLPFLESYDRTVFTMRRFIGPSLDYTKTRIVEPAIDPLNSKNHHLGREEAQRIVKRFGIDTTKPLVSQISRFDPWKDPWGVIDAYRLAKKTFPGLQLALVGVLADDDPEGQVILADLKKYAGNDKSIFILSNLDGVGSVEVNAFQSASALVIQKSTREGFGLSVAEAMWKKRVVIGGRAGGIAEQIEEGKNGFLVTTAAQAAEKIVWVLEHPKEVAQMEEAAYQSVREKFLTPRLLLNHLNLYLELL